MAWYDVTYSCGHEGRVQLYGKEADRQRKIEWYEDCAVCPDCYKAEQERKRQEANEAAKKRAEEMNLPELTGSPKQIAWANTLRDERLEQEKACYEANIRHNELLLKEQPERQKEFEQANKELAESEKEYREYLISHTESKWWIDKRNWDGTELHDEYLEMKAKKEQEEN